MSIRANFKTDLNLEKNGIELDYDSERITVRRAGGSNKRYKAALVKALKPLRSALEAGVATDAQVLKASIPAFVDCVILNWQTDPDGEGEYQKGLEGPEGLPVEYNRENAIAFLMEMPEFFAQLHEDSKERRLFLVSMEAAAKN